MWEWFFGSSSGGFEVVLALEGFGLDWCCGLAEGWLCGIGMRKGGGGGLFGAF